MKLIRRKIMKKLTRTLKSIGAIVLALALAITPMPGKTADVKAEIKENFTIKLENYNNGGTVKLTLVQEENAEEPTGEEETTTKKPLKDKETADIVNGEAKFEDFVDTDEKYDIEITGLEKIKNYKKKAVQFSGNEYTVAKEDLKNEISVSGKVYGQIVGTEQFEPLKDVEVEYACDDKTGEIVSHTTSTDSDGEYSITMFKGDRVDLVYKLTDSAQKKKYGNGNKIGSYSNVQSGPLDDVKFELDKFTISNTCDSSMKDMKINDEMVKPGKATEQEIKYGSKPVITIYPNLKTGFDLNQLKVTNDGVTETISRDSSKIKINANHSYEYTMDAVNGNCEISYTEEKVNEETYFTHLTAGNYTVAGASGDKSYYIDNRSEQDLTNAIESKDDGSADLPLEGIDVNVQDNYKQKIFNVYHIVNNKPVLYKTVHIYYDSGVPVIDEIRIEDETIYDKLVGGYLNSKFFYKEQVIVKVYASEPEKTNERQSGLKDAKLFNDETKYPKSPFNGTFATIKIPKEDITSDGWHINKVLSAEVTDNAGNIGKDTASGDTLSTTLMLIENVKPIIDEPIIIEDGTETKLSEKTIYKGDVKVRVTIHDDQGEEGTNADSDAAAFEDKISGINNVSVIDKKDSTNTIPVDEVNTKTTKEGMVSEKVITFDTKDASKKDGYYEITVNATDNATNEPDNPVTIKIGKDTFNPFIEKMTFTSVGYKNDTEVTDLAETTKEYWENVKVEDYGYYFRKKTLVTIYASDVDPDKDSATSGVDKIEYYRLAKGQSEDTKELRYAEKQGNTFTFEVEEGFKGQIYARAIDNVGNTPDNYVNPEGTIVEDEERHNTQDTPHITFDYKTKDVPQDAKDHYLYSSNQDIGVTVVDDFSGIRKVEWTISSEVNDLHQSGEVTVNNKGIVNDPVIKGKNNITGWVVPKDGKDSNLVTKLTNTFKISNNSNDIKITVKLTDRAGNTSGKDDKVKNPSCKTHTFSIDKTAPKVVVKMAANDDSQYDGYFKNNRKYDVYVYERNINKNKVKMTGTRIDKQYKKRNYSLSHNFKKIGDTMIGDAKVYVYKKSGTFKAEGEYKFGIDTTDLAKNHTSDKQVKYSKDVKPKKKNSKNTQQPNAQQGSTQTNTKVNADNNKLLDYKKQNNKDKRIDKHFVIDKTTPKVTVTYDNNNAVNGKYFPQARTATIKIDEHNFVNEHNRIVINKKASKDGSAIAGASMSNWSHKDDTNIYKATIPYTQDGDYQFAIDVTDKAGNKVSDSGVNYPNGRELSKDFVIDQTVEKPIIGGVENGKSYPEKCIPTIQVNDTNYESSEVKLLRTQKDDIDRDVTSKYIKSLPANGSTVSEDYFDKLKANDGIYKLSVNITDMAGNTDSEEVSFTVNRFGSVYEFSKDLVDLQDSYVNKVDGDIYIREFNPDQLIEDSVEMQVQRNQEPVENVKYDVSPEVNKKVKIGSSGWYQYKYDIGNDNFKKDGIYTVNVKTKDDAGNTPESNNQSEIRFSVDTQKPDVVNVKGMESASVNAREQKVDYLIHDTIGLKSIVVTVDGKEVAKVSEFADPTNYEGNFTIKEGFQRKVNLKITDLAGNVTNTADTDFNPEYDFNSTITVSTNIFLLWFANKWLFFGTLIGLAAIAAAIAYLIRRKIAGKIL